MVKRSKETRRAIRVYLAQHDKTQRWLADKLGVHESFLSDVIGGRRPLSEKVADDLQRLTGIDLRDQIGAA